MTVESATYLNTLDPTKPSATDPKSEGDDHLRLLKSVLQATFPNVAGAVTPTHVELGCVAGVTSAIQTQLNNKASANGQTWTGTHDFTGATANFATQATSDNSTKAASTAYVQANMALKGSIAGQAWTGTHDFTGATITVPTQAASDNSTKPATTAFVQTATTQAFNGTSTSSLTIGTGAQSFTTQASKAWALGQAVTIANSTSAYMVGIVSSYNSGTGAMTVSVNSVVGSGTYASWTITPAPNVAVSLALPTVLISTNTTAVAGKHYVFTGACTLTLPTSPGLDDVIEISNASGLITCVVDFGSTKLRGQSPGAMTVVDVNFNCRLQWSGNTSYGWA